MSALLAMPKGMRGTMRSIRWSPVLSVPVAAAVALLAVRLTGPRIDELAMVGDVGLVFTAVSVAFVVDDVALEAAPATPVGARARLVARAAVAVPVAVAGWLLVLLVYRSVLSSGGGPEVAERATSGLALAVAALGLASLGGKLRSVVSPGAAGMGAMAGVGVAWSVSPDAWVRVLPSGDVACLAAIVFGLVAVTVATKEPAT